MFPFAFEWVDGAPHFIFMGTLYTVLLLLFFIVNLCGIKAAIAWLCQKEEGSHDTHHE